MSKYKELHAMHMYHEITAGQFIKPHAERVSEHFKESKCSSILPLLTREKLLMLATESDSLFELSSSKKRLGHDTTNSA